MNIYAETPRILRETAAGYTTFEVVDEMFHNRELECVGEINDQSVYSLCRQLRHLQQEDPEGEITLYINSPGGEVSSGLAHYDVMQAISCPIRTVCLGKAASMGAILFAAGDKREILPHGEVDPRPLDLRGRGGKRALGPGDQPPAAQDPADPGGHPGPAHREKPAGDL